MDRHIPLNVGFGKEHWMEDIWVLVPHCHGKDKGFIEGYYFSSFTLVGWPQMAESAATAGRFFFLLFLSEHALALQQHLCLAC